MAGSPPLDPSDLEQATFDVVRRGWDPKAVQRTLQRAADALREVERQRAALAAQVDEFEATPSDSLEAHKVAEALGVEAAAVLEAAHAAAAERAGRAEREAEAIRAESLAAAEQARIETAAIRDEAALMTEHARSEAAVIRAEAATELEQAKAASATIREEAAAAGRADAEETIAAARREAEQIVDDGRREAEQIVEEGRRRGRDMVNEAQIVRERMLGDLARKRQTGRAQVEQLRAGRDRLLETLSVAQSSLDTAMKDLVDAVPEARGAAERAGLRVANESTPTVEALEAEIEAARLVGHPLVEGVADPGAPVEEVAGQPDPSFVTAEMEALTHIDEALEAADEPDQPDEPGVDEPEDAGAERNEIDDAEPEDAEPFDDDDDDGEEAGADDLEPVMVDLDVSDTVGSDPDTPEIDDGADLFDGSDDGAAGIEDEASADAVAGHEAEVVDLSEPEPTLAELDDSGPDPDAMLAEQLAAVVAPDDGGGGPDAEPVPESDEVGDLFARLRDARPTDETADGGERTEAAEDEPESETGAEPAPTEAADDPAPEDGPEPDAPAEPARAEDPAGPARERAISVATRALKKVVVEEQGTLLDGIRRTGAEAVSVVLADTDEHAAAYEDAATPAFSELVDALGGSAEQLPAAFDQLRSVALDPVRQRLLDAAADSDDGDELSDVVRGLYRESRSRRIPMAVTAAVTALTGAVTVATATGSIRWVVDPDGDCGPDCADNALAGSITPGEVFPTGVLHPPTDPTCTCRLVVED